MQPKLVQYLLNYVSDTTLEQLILFAKELPYSKETLEHTFFISKKPFVVFDRSNNSVITRIAEKNGKEVIAGITKTEPIDSKTPWVKILLNEIENLSFLKGLILDSFHQVANKKALDKLYSEFPF